MSERAEKVAGVIRRALAEPIRRLSQDVSAGLVTVTTVRMSGDLHIARVYFSMYGSKISPAEFIAIMEQRSGYLRREIGKSLKLRYTPDLKFFIDDTLEQMDHIKRLLDKAKTESHSPAEESEEENAED